MILIYMFFLHFLADFILQPREMGRKKSTSFNYLAAHIGIQIAVFAIGLSFFIPIFAAIAFALMNGVLHAIIDAFIWKGYAWSVWKRRKDKNITKENLKVSWKYWDDHWFYVTIGLDQFLHIASIVLILVLLT